MGENKPSGEWSVYKHSVGIYGLVSANSALDLGRAFLEKVISFHVP
jgi:hypothetical protein